MFDTHVSDVSKKQEQKHNKDNYDMNKESKPTRSQLLRDEPACRLCFD